ESSYASCTSSVAVPSGGNELSRASPALLSTVVGSAARSPSSAQSALGKRSASWPPLVLMNLPMPPTTAVLPYWWATGAIVRTSQPPTPAGFGEKAILTSSPNQSRLSTPFGVVKLISWSSTTISSSPVTSLNCQPPRPRSPSSSPSGTITAVGAPAEVQARSAV